MARLSVKISFKVKLVLEPLASRKKWIWLQRSFLTDPSEIDGSTVMRFKEFQYQLDLDLKRGVDRHN